MHPLLPLMLSLALPAMAGNFNIVNLAHQKDLTIDISCDHREQAIILQSGSDSGTFTLPEKDAEFRIKDHKIQPCKVGADRAGRIVVIYQKGDELHWHTVTSKAQKNITSLRLINLTSQDVCIKMNEKTVDLAAGNDHDAGASDSLTLSVTLGDQKKQSVKVEEATAFVGIVYPTAAGPRFQFVADR